MTWGRNTFKLSKPFLGCYDVAIWMICLYRAPLSIPLKCLSNPSPLSSDGTSLKILPFHSFFLLHSLIITTFFPSCINGRATSLSLRPVFSPLSIWSPHPLAFSTTLSSSSVPYTYKWVHLSSIFKTNKIN